MSGSVSTTYDGSPNRRQKAIGLTPRDTCHVERDYRPVSHHNAVRLSSVDNVIDHGGHPIACLLGRLGSKHKLVRLAEELLDGCLEVVSPRI